MCTPPSPPNPTCPTVDSEFAKRRLSFISQFGRVLTASSDVHRASRTREVMLSAIRTRLFVLLLILALVLAVIINVVINVVGLHSAKDVWHHVQLPTVLVTFSDGRTLGEGMHLLASDVDGSWDGRRWRLPARDPLVFVPGRDATGIAWTNAGGPPTVFRDPSFAWHEGFFHLVFTTELCTGMTTLAFHCDSRKRRRDLPARFGYARSRDLLHWEGTRPVVVDSLEMCNVWAPELYMLDDDDRRSSAELQRAIAIVVFSATLAPSGSLISCPWDFGPSAGTTRHEPMYMSTADFETWSPPQRLFDPSESAIDTILFRAPAEMYAEMAETPSAALTLRKVHLESPSPKGGGWGSGGGLSTYAIYKSEHNGAPGQRCLWQAGHQGGSSVSSQASLGNASCTLALRLMHAPSVLGPYEKVELAQAPVWRDAISRPCAEGPTLIPLRSAAGDTGSRAPAPAAGLPLVAGLPPGWLLLYDGYRSDCVLLWDGAGAAARERGGTTYGVNASGACEPRSGLRLVDGKEAGLTSEQQQFVQKGGWRCIYMGESGFGALHSSDLRSWRDVSDGLIIPRHHKHGTAQQLSPMGLCGICRAASELEDTRMMWSALGVLQLCEDDLIGPWCRAHPWRAGEAEASMAAATPTRDMLVPYIMAVSILWMLVCACTASVVGLQTGKVKAQCANARARER